MKKILTATMLAFAVLMTAGCNSWLKIEPRTEKDKNDLFSSQQGFQDALIGVYIQMLQESAYGANLTFYMVECMGSLYEATSNSTEAKLMSHSWADPDVESIINSTFAKLYKIISSANSLLEVIDEKKNVFDSEDEYGIIKGEALTIRAMCHFDLLRLFGPVPSQADDKRILPYVTKFGRELTEHSTWDEYCDLLLQDINDAEEALAADPICSYSIADLSNPNGTGSQYKTENTFFAYRHLRFNYYAVKALQARINLWLGNDGDALAAAETVINAKNPDGTEKFSLGTATSFANDDITFSSEHLMSLYDASLATKYTRYFSSGKIYRGKTYSTIKDELYGASGVDIREPETGKWWALFALANGTTGCISNKFQADDDTDTGTGLRIPLLRLAEMYLIAVETAPLPDAQTYYATFLRSRNMAPPTLTENRMNVLRKEYIKEFYAEGHIFYLYKRLDAEKNDILWAPSALTPVYVLPKPSDELVYGE